MIRFFILLVLSVLVSCSTTDEPEPFTVISPVTMMELMEHSDDFILLDLRTTEEIAAGSVEGAAFLDYHLEDFAERLNAMDKGKTYGLYCGSGIRSNRAMQMMEEMGFSRVYDMEGGYNAYRESVANE